MHFVRRLLTVFVLAVPVLCGCSGNPESVAPLQNKTKAATKTESKSGGYPGPKSWETDSATEATMTFYVEGMSKRLKLT